MESDHRSTDLSEKAGASDPILDGQLFYNIPPSGASTAGITGSPPVVSHPIAARNTPWDRDRNRLSYRVFRDRTKKNLPGHLVSFRCFSLV